jgi:hypothetical protein
MPPNMGTGQVNHIGAGVLDFDKFEILVCKGCSRGAAGGELISVIRSAGSEEMYNSRRRTPRVGIERAANTAIAGKHEGAV